MVNSCAVPGCPTKASDLEVSFHRVPRDPILFEQWNSSIRLDQYGGQLSPTAHVCSIHFRESDFWVSSKGVTFLKRYAVPTVFDMCTNSTEESSTKNVHQIIKPKEDRKNSAVPLSGKKSSFISCTKREPQPCTSQKGARNSITSKQKKSPITSTVKKEMPSTSQSNGNTSSPSKLGGEVCRKNVFIVRGNETFSVVVEKCNTPSSNKRPAEDGDGEWKAKRVCRLPDCNVRKPHFVCADCKKKKVVLEPFKIGTDFTIFMCPMEECVYPLGEVNLYRFLYKKLPNNSQRPCTRAEAPTLDDIVAVISSSDQ